MEYKLDQIVNKAAFKSNKDEHESLAVHRRCKEEEGGGGLGRSMRVTGYENRSSNKASCFFGLFLFVCDFESVVRDWGRMCKIFHVHQSKRNVNSRLNEDREWIDAGRHVTCGFRYNGDLFSLYVLHCFLSRSSCLITPNHFT